MSNIFHITTGDTDGIGLEVTLKALPQVLNKTSRSKFIIWVHSSQKKKIVSFLSKNNQVHSHSLFLENLNSNLELKKYNFLINKKETPATWFVNAVRRCLEKNENIITGPLSKTQIKNEGFNAIGHTEILKSLTGCKNLNMAFVGKYFSMILYTGHIPISKVQVDKKSFLDFMKTAYKFHCNFKSKKSDLLVLGLNPHAGDSGLIGKEDQEILKLVKDNFNINKLLPADSAFINYKSFKLNPTFISLYHDQGLIPFKMAHGFTGYHFTLGLPFVRTSVDHGTAKDIFNTNKANPHSMIDAILGAIKLDTKFKKN